MNRRVLFATLSLAFAGVPGAFASAGIPDRVPAATLIVPMFRTGVDLATVPDDTLLVVQNVHGAPVQFHYHYWDVVGRAVDLFGNVTLEPNGTWSVASRDLLNAASSEVRTALVHHYQWGQYYAGFVTIDVVSSSTSLSPGAAGYPFATTNALEGFVYYTRLSKGSANGLAMVPIEHVGSEVSPLLHGFYTAADGREEIDADARACNAQVARALACTGDADHALQRVDFRRFGSQPLNGVTQVIYFAWSPDVGIGGPSALCPSHGCATSYPCAMYDETGAVLDASNCTLPNVVSAFSFPPGSVPAGMTTILGIASVSSATQFFAFSLNSASPANDPDLTWDAIFEAYVLP